MKRRVDWLLLWIAVLLMATSGAAVAQLQTGSLYGVVLDPERAPLPGTTVTLSGVGAPQTQLSDAQGRFRYVGLAPGAYHLQAHLEGFSPVEVDNLIVHVGRNTDVEVHLPAGISEALTVTTEALLLDERRIAKGNTFTLTELERIPTARDPWSVISSTPGVLLDRINVGGSETGTQALIVGPGSRSDQVVWALDGMIITDMAALGTAPGFFDFDSFEEIEVTTGGADASIASGGVVLNMVTKRGTNQWRGSGRFYYANEKLRSKLDIDESELGQAGAWNRFTAQTDFKQGNRIDYLRDWGLEGGGPVLTDRLWLWGSYARPVIRKLTNEDFVDEELGTAWNVKLNGTLREGNTFTAFAWDDDKIKHGISVSSLRPPETAWERSDYGSEPTAWKVEDTQVVGASFYATAFYSRVNGGYTLSPTGGEKLPFLDDEEVWHNSYAEYVTDRPQRQVQAEASSYLNTGRWSHELKYGAGYRVVEVRSASRFPGGGMEFGQIGLLYLTREGAANLDGEYTSAFVQDTLAAGRLTVNLGLRWDRQTGSNLPTTVRANPVAPDLLPEAHFEGGDAGFVWEDLVPRLGATWALGEKRNTLLRASYSRYADQLGSRYISWTNPVAYMQYRYFYTDNGGDPVLERDEIFDEWAPPASNVHPVTFGALSSSAVAADLEAPLTDEFLLGVEHSFLPDLVVGVHGSYRLFTGLVESEVLVFDGDAFAEENLGRLGRPHRGDDYIYRTVNVSGPDGQSYPVRIGELRPGVSSRNGLLLQNGDREQVYKGLFLTLNKRLSGGWMARGHVSLQDWRWRIPDGANEDLTDDVAGGIRDGSEVLSGRSVGGAKGNVFISNGWSYSVSGLYQVARSRPWGFNVAAALNGREGYPIRYTQRVFRATVNTGLATYIPVTSDTGRFKYPDVHILDLRVEKDFTVRGLGLTVGADLFNALNEPYVLQRSLVLGRVNSDHVVEVVSPRILRLGVRFRLR